MKSGDLETYFAAKPLRFLTGFRHAALNYCQMHFHQAFEIVYHPTGRGVTKIKSGESVAYDENGVVVYAPFMSHDQTPQTAGEDVCLQFDSALPLPAALQKCIYVPPLRDGHLIAEINDLARFNASGLSALQKTALNCRINALLIHFVQASSAASAGARRPSTERYAEAARSHITSHSQEISRIEDVAAHVGVSHTYLRHLFKEHYGVTLAAYLNQARVERAKDLLTRSALPLKIVATMCGFDNERYFSHVFKKHSRCTPGEFRGRLLHF